MAKALKRLLGADRGIKKVAKVDCDAEIDNASLIRSRLPQGCGGHVAVHGRDKYLTLLACGGVALGSQ